MSDDRQPAAGSASDDRELNWAGHSVEYIAAMYETDQLIREFPMPDNQVHPAVQTAAQAEWAEGELDDQWAADHNWQPKPYGAP